MTRRIITAIALAAAPIVAAIAWPIALVYWELSWRRTRREIERQREPYEAPEWVG